MNEQRRRQRFKRAIYETRFDRFLLANGVDLDALTAAIGMTRPNLVRLRSGKQKPRQDTIAAIVLALRRILARDVAASDLFYLGEARDDHTPEAKEFPNAA